MIRATECEHFSGTMLDAAAGLVPPSPEFESHLRTCVTCYEQFHELRGTMELLDEWSGPEPSSRFDALLRVRLLEAHSPHRTRWWPPLSRTVGALTLASLLMAGVLVVQRTTHRDIMASAPMESDVSALPGSAVGDLQSLQEADELLADFDLLDELAPDQSHPSNQN